MSLPAARLIWHTLIALVLLVTGVVAPLLLLFRKELGIVALVLGLGLLAVGSGALLGAGLSRGIDSTACTPLQWRCMLTAAWLLNPVIVVATSVATGHLEFAWWSGMPLFFVLTALSGRLRLMQSYPDWRQEGCVFNPYMILYWTFSRAVFIGFPLAFLSFQVTLYLPRSDMLPIGPQIGLFVCGGCVLISAKFCAMCACLAPDANGRQKLPQALVLVILLSADWISSLHLMVPQTIDDNTKETLLLFHLLAAGFIQLHITLRRLQLIPRWQRARAQPRARELGIERDGNDPEMNAGLNAGQGESSDSEDDQGPRSLPPGFHEALIGVLGVPRPSSGQVQRAFLAEERSATLRPHVGHHQATVTPQPPLQLSAEGVSVEPTPRLGGGADAAGGSALAQANTASSSSSISHFDVDASESAAGSAGSVVQPRPLEIAPCTKCSICQEEICSGDKVRPLPKCGHVFHSTCIDGWAKAKQEGTRCPNCRKPALSRKQADGAIHISALSSNGGRGEGERASGSRRLRHASTAGQGTPSAAGGLGPVRPPAVVRRNSALIARRTAARDQNIRALCGLGFTELLARVALEFENNPNDAANLITDHIQLLETVYSRDGACPTTPRGVAEAVVEANPNLADLVVPLRRQLEHLYGSNRLPKQPWSELSTEQIDQVFHALLGDVVERNRGGRN
mmetsp:Transcript_73369/g.185012  ORF Transcript_73369/g.185012 Transcript_73369/m.185012 type:complete len:683 (-) Transcript_73369:144-2192(-)